MKIVTQVLDGTCGQSAAGIHVRLSRVKGDGWITVADANTDSEGRIEDWNDRLTRGLYRIVLDSGGYFAALGTIAAYPDVMVMFRMQDESSTVHVIVTLSPYSYSTYFGTINNHPESR